MSENHPAATSSGFKLRPARPDEVEQVVEFQRAMARETEAINLEPATVRRGVAAVFEHPERGQYWMAEAAASPTTDTAHDSVVAGCLLTMNEWSDWRNGTVLWIHSVYVAPAFRRRGVFRAMYQHFEAMVGADQTLLGLRLFVARENHVAQRTYADMGMSDEHYRLFEWLKT